MTSATRVTLLALLPLASACVSQTVNLRPVSGEMSLPHSSHTFVAPSGWMQQMLPDPGVSLRRDGHTLSQIYVVREAFTPAENAAVVRVEDFLQAMDEKLEHDGLESPWGHLTLAGRSSITLDGVSARRYALVTGERRGIAVLTCTPGAIVMLRYLGREDALPRDLPDFEAVVESFRFGDAAARAHGNCMP